MTGRSDTDAYMDDDTSASPDRGSPRSTPLWVSVLGIAIALALLLLIVILHLTGTMGAGLHG